MKIFLVFQIDVLSSSAAHKNWSNGTSAAMYSQFYNQEVTSSSSYNLENIFNIKKIFMHTKLCSTFTASVSVVCLLRTPLGLNWWQMLLKSKTSPTVCILIFFLSLNWLEENYLLVPSKEEQNNLKRLIYLMKPTTIARWKQKMDWPGQEWHHLLNHRPPASSQVCQIQSARDGRVSYCEWRNFSTSGLRLLFASHHQTWVINMDNTAMRICSRRTKVSVQYMCIKQAFLWFTRIKILKFVQNYIHYSNLIQSFYDHFPSWHMGWHFQIFSSFSCKFTTL